MVNWSIKINYTAGPLPVSLLSFSGNREGSKNLLKWTTVSEQNNRGFGIERSAIGVTYSTIGFVNSLAPVGNSTVSLNYFFTDSNSTANRQFYRLRQTDLDNREKLSTIVLIKGTNPPVLTLASLFPNPASDVLNVLLNTPYPGKMNLQVIDLNGRLIMQKAVFVETGANTIPIAIKGLDRGIYFLKVTAEQDSEFVISRFEKQ